MAKLQHLRAFLELILVLGYCKPTVSLERPSLVNKHMWKPFTHLRMSQHCNHDSDLDKQLNYLSAAIQKIGTVLIKLKPAINIMGIVWKKSLSKDIIWLHHSQQHVPHRFVSSFGPICSQSVLIPPEHGRGLVQFLLRLWNLPPQVTVHVVKFYHWK